MSETLRKPHPGEAPEPCNASKRQVGEFAEGIARRLGYDPQTKDVFAVIEALGGRIEYQNSPETVPDNPPSLEVARLGQFTVSLSGLCGPDRNSFSAAHELGHYLLHYVAPKRGDRMVATRSGLDTRVEWEANWFASAFLMPEDKFRAEFDRWKSVDIVAMQFRVSRKAAEVRAKSLGLIEA